MAARKRTSRTGFTLVEAIATMTILAVVSLGASRIIFAAVDAYAADATRAELTLDLSAAMERIAAELRSIPSRSGRPGTPWIDEVSTSAIVFGGSMAIELDGTELTLTAAGSDARPLIGDVSSFTLVCFDGLGQPLGLPLMTGPACDQVRRIQVSVTRTVNGVSETLRTRVYLRCTMAGGGS